MKNHFEGQLVERDSKIEAIEGQLVESGSKIEAIGGQLAQKDQQINQLTNTVNGMKTQFQVKIRIISKVSYLKSKPICLLQDFQYSDEEPF